MSEFYIGNKAVVHFLDMRDEVNCHRIHVRHKPNMWQICAYGLSIMVLWGN